MGIAGRCSMSARRTDLPLTVRSCRGAEWRELESTAVIVAAFKVHFQATTPAPSWTAWKQWQTGQLTVHNDHAEFQGRTGERVVISGVTAVSQSSRRELYREHDISWMVNTWIAVSYTAPEPRVAYVNDGRLLGHYLPHRHMRHCLEALVGTAAT